MTRFFTGNCVRMQRHSAAFPEVLRDRPPLGGDPRPRRRGIGEPVCSRTALSPGLPRGGCKPPLKRTFFPRLVCSPGAVVSRCSPWPRGSSIAARLAAPATARPRPGPPRSRSRRRRWSDAAAGRAHRSGPVLRSWSRVVASAGGLQVALEKNVLSKARLQPPGRPPGSPARLSRSALRPAGSEGPGRLCRIARRNSDGGGPAGGIGNAGRHGWLGVGRPDRRPRRAPRTDGLVRRSWGSVWRGVPRRALSRPSCRSPGGRPAAPRTLLKEESFLEGFVVPGWGRLGAAGHQRADPAGGKTRVPRPGVGVSRRAGRRPARSERPGRSRRIARRSSDGGGPAGGMGHARPP
jgi:hypothetical protein